VPRNHDSADDDDSLVLETNTTRETLALSSCRINLSLGVGHEAYRNVRLSERVAAI